MTGPGTPSGRGPVRGARPAAMPPVVPPAHHPVARPSATLDLPPVIAHRGASEVAPENTLAAFREAARLGATWVELDVALSADGHAVVIHDDTLDRTTDGSGRVADRTLAALRRLDAGGWFSRAYRGEPLPTLREALGEIRRLGLGVNVELKTIPGAESGLARAAASDLAECWAVPDGRVVVSSFGPMTLAALREVAPDWPRALLVAHPRGDWLVPATALGCVGVHVNHRRLTPAAVKAARGAGFRIAAYTVNAPVRARRLAEWGVETMITDQPDRIAAALSAARPPRRFAFRRLVF